MKKIIFSVFIVMFFSSMLFLASCSKDDDVTENNDNNNNNVTDYAPAPANFGQCTLRLAEDNG